MLIPQTLLQANTNVTDVPTVMSDVPHTQHSLTAFYMAGTIINQHWSCECSKFLTLSVRLEVERDFACPSLRAHSLMVASLVSSLAMLTTHTYSASPQWTVSANSTLTMYGTNECLVLMLCFSAPLKIECLVLMLRFSAPLKIECLVLMLRFSAPLKNTGTNECLILMLCFSALLKKHSALVSH